MKRINYIVIDSRSMLESVRALGVSLHEKPSLMDYLSVAKLGKTRKVLEIVVDKNSYLQISLEDKCK